MNPEKQRIAIAEACGILDPKPGYIVVSRRWESKNDIVQLIKDFKGAIFPQTIYAVPDYLNDGNAIKAAVRQLASTRHFKELYLGALYRIIGTVGASGGSFHDVVEHEWKLNTATAGQCCEAAVRALNKWEDGE